MQINNLINNDENNLLKKRGSNLFSQTKQNFSVLLTMNTTVCKNLEDDDISNEKIEVNCMCNIESISNNINDKVYTEQELVPELELEVSHNNTIQVNELVFSLKKAGFPLTGSIIYLFHREAGDYILCGSDPIDESISFDSELFSGNIIKIKVYAFVDQLDLVVPKSDKTTKNGIGEKREKPKRTKERKIGYIVEKVNTWRKLYNGYYDEGKEFKKFSLDEAARMVKISKKSLDDYLLQLRLGRKYGFDFNKFRGSRVGVLRSFVKENRTKFTNYSQKHNEI